MLLSVRKSNSVSCLSERVLISRDELKPQANQNAHSGVLKIEAALFNE